MVPRALAARVRRLCGEEGREEEKEGEEVDEKVEENRRWRRAEKEGAREWWMPCFDTAERGGGGCKGGPEEKEDGSVQAGRRRSE